MGGGDAMSQDDLDKLFDSADDAEIEPEPEPEPEPVASSDDDAEDVFELTEDLAVEDDEMDMAAAMAMDEMQAGDVAFVEPESEPEPEVAPDPEPAPQVGSARAAIGDDGLLSADANQAVHSAFTNLAGTILSNNSRTLEDLVKELLRPMLKEWLDDNLPSMVERMVRQEIERISRGR